VFLSPSTQSGKDNIVSPIILKKDIKEFKLIEDTPIKRNHLKSSKDLFLSANPKLKIEFNENNLNFS
jgi:hypothetical protein